jgi:glycosyltransferase involved in cell wall biosynthesis
MRVALVHDWLTGMRGGEKVLDQVCRLYPDADLFTLVHVPGSTSPTIERRRIVTSVVQRLPRSDRWYRQYLPLFPFAIEQFNFDGYDLVISISHCGAKSVVVSGRTRHLCYCLTPMRYAWDQFDAYFGPLQVGPVKSRLLRPTLARLARWDRATSGRAHRYLAISQHVARRIALYYNRESAIVHPPVDTAFFTPDSSSVGLRFLIVSALVPYKRLDIAIAAARQAAVRLTIVGEGPERERLQSQAGDEVEWLGWRTDAEVRDLYRSCVATLLPGEEDFGIVPVEAQACGRPVVALGRGGALDTVKNGETGILVDQPTVESFAAGLRRAAATQWDTHRIRQNAERFSQDVFRLALTQAVDETLAAPAGTRW